MDFLDKEEEIEIKEDFFVGFYLPDEEPYGCFSNWYMAEFDLAGNHYSSVEQYMMFQKAITFRRYETSREIMKTDDPKEIKELADKNHMPLKDDELKIWTAIRRAVVKRGVRQKFIQNPELISVLLSTGNRVIAECSKEDSVWGIGIDINDPARLDADAWNGENIMGRILMELRQEFRINMLTASDYSIHYEDAMPLKSIYEWELKAGELKRHPAYYKCINAYAQTLITDEIRNAFYNTPLSDTEIVISTSLGGGYPVAGFYEMKQDVYDISFYLNKYLG